LLSTSQDPAAQLDAEAGAFWESLGGISVQIGPDGPVRDLDGSYARWFGAAGVDVVLQRPDFYLFGSSPIEGTGELLSRLRRALAGNAA